jgi:hypothetical protein
MSKSSNHLTMQEMLNCIDDQMWRITNQGLLDAILEGRVKIGQEIPIIATGNFKLNDDGSIPDNLPEPQILRITYDFVEKLKKTVYGSN